jgi:Protein of unknown function (DUF1353)
MRLSLITFSAVLIVSAPVAAEEFFGVFPDALEGTFMVADPRPQFKLKKEFIFKDPNGLAWNVPSGEVVDGASIPQIFWSFIGGPFDGKYINASVIHDYYCRTKSRTAHDTHRNFYYGMRAVGLSEWQANAMYWAVSTFGPDWKLERRIAQELRCTETNGTTTCMAVAVPTTMMVESAIDWEDPEVRAIALSKFSAVAKTLKTSSGRTLDVNRFGRIEATPQSIEANAEGFRELLSTKAYRTNSADLGLLTEAESVPLGQIISWPDSKIPDFTKAPTLRELIAEDRIGEAFKVQPTDLRLLEKKISPAVGTFNMPSTLAR